MLKEKEFIQISLELNLFFTRIIKEHMVFMEAGLFMENKDLIVRIDKLKRTFEELLDETIYLSNGVLSQAAINSNEFITPYTLKAESMIESFTGISINQNLTIKQLDLKANIDFNWPLNLGDQVFQLNNRAINLIIDIINFQENILTQVANCDIFISIYPSMVDHIIQEAKFYLKNLIDLQEMKVPEKDMLETEVFWDHVMEKHSEFIRGLLDPAEKDLFHKANDFATIFERLIEETENANQGNIIKITKKNLQTTNELARFKTSATKGLLECEIQSLINPLLADHVMREANRYIRILKTYLKI